MRGLMNLKTPLSVHPLTRVSEEGDSWADELTLEISPQAIPALPAVKSVTRVATLPASANDGVILAARFQFDFLALSCISA